MVRLVDIRCMNLANWYRKQTLFESDGELWRARKRGDGKIGTKEQSKITKHSMGFCREEVRRMFFRPVVGCKVVAICCYDYSTWHGRELYTVYGSGVFRQQ